MQTKKELDVISTVLTEVEDDRTKEIHKLMGIVDKHMISIEDHEKCISWLEKEIDSLNAHLNFLEQEILDDYENGEYSDIL